MQLKEYEALSAQVLLAHFLEVFSGKVVLASSFGAEDQVLTDLVMKINPLTEIFTINTGRLHRETLELLEITQKRYGFSYKVYFPCSDQVDQFNQEKGLDSIYDSIENRKSCCFIRKIEPLQRALDGVAGWITGMRRAQSVTRRETSKVERDDAHGGIYKINPLALWSHADVWNYIKANDVPYNPLHDQGYPSIGCEPCTRAVRVEEDLRGGRWWWEKSEQKECGLHRRDQQ